MFYKPKVFLCLGLLLSLSSMGLFVAFYKGTSQKVALLEKSPPISTLQKRHDVTKHIWINQKGQRLEWLIESPTSLLALTRNQNGSSIIETLSQMKLWMQEKLSLDSQEIRYLKASVGVFNYSLMRLDAKDALITAYLAKGNSIDPFQSPDLTFIKGLSKEASLFFEKNRAVFEAKGFSAYIQLEKNL